MNPLILFGLLGAGGIFFMSTRTGSSDSGRLYNLPDIAAAEQKGNYKTDYDFYFESIAAKTDVPFALMKAHAIRESSLKPNAKADEGKGRYSYGLMQVLWTPGEDRFAKWGYYADNMQNGQKLFDIYTNIHIAGLIIKENLERFDGNLRDAINAYNTGVKESVRVAPANYVNDVLKYYTEIVGVSPV